MKTIKYLLLVVIMVSLSSCDDDDNGGLTSEPLPELTAGSADFSTFVTIGTSYTAGFTDGALFRAAQENSYPNILAQQFSLAGGGDFLQPLMNDNFGGLALGGNRIADPRLGFDGSGPTGIENLIGPVTVSTDIALNNPSGPFNNLGIPGLKSFHPLVPGYGNITNLPSAANPYAVRVTGNNPDATLLELALAQNPTFFILGELGGNDVLGYATSGGDGTDLITPVATLEASISAAVSALTANGAKGAIGNIGDIKDLPFFTTVPYNPLDPSNPSYGPLIPTLNTIYGALNDVYAFLQSQGVTAAAGRNVVFSSDAASAVVIIDESLVDLSAQIAGVLNANPDFPAFVGQFGLPPQAAPVVANLLGQTYGQARQATEADLLVLRSSSIIGTVNSGVAAALIQQGLPAAVAGQFAVEGVTLPLADKWVLIPTEQDEIETATAGYNAAIESIANTNGLAFLDLNGLFANIGNGISFDDFILTNDLVLGGAVSLDGIHFTARGNALFAREYLKVIDEAYGSNFIASGSVPKAGDYPTNYPANLQ